MTDLIVLTSYFNPCKYKSKLKNYQIFRENIKRQDIKLLTIECAFNNEDYELTTDSADILIQVRSNSRIWQKERLLNIAIESIPSEYSKYCISDCDLIFNNENWASETSKLLDNYPVVQPFEYCCREKAPIGNFEGIKLLPSFVKQFHINYSVAGHCGYAWAFRKDKINYLYDKLIIGGGDSILAYSIFNIHSWTRNHAPLKLKLDIDKWAADIYQKVQSNVRFTEGVVQHLWHGDPINRKYSDRQSILKHVKFDPTQDLYLNEFNCWETTDQIETLISKYLYSRKEDDI